MSIFRKFREIAFVWSRVPILQWFGIFSFIKKVYLLLERVSVCIRIENIIRIHAEVVDIR